MDVFWRERYCLGLPCCSCSVSTRRCSSVLDFDWIIILHCCSWGWGKGWGWALRCWWINSKCSWRKNSFNQRIKANKIMVINHPYIRTNTTSPATIHITRQDLYDIGASYSTKPCELHRTEEEEAVTLTCRWLDNNFYNYPTQLHVDGKYCIDYPRNLTNHGWYKNVILTSPFISSCI